MKNNSSHPSVCELEGLFLRKWGWLLPVAALGLALLCLGGFWEWVAATPRWAWKKPGLFDRRLLLFLLPGILLPVVWAWSRRKPVRGAVVWMGAVAGILFLDAAVRHPVVQIPFWLAARARLEADQTFMREVCYIRLEESRSHRPEAPAVLVVGSSQVLNGVDEQQLRQLLAPTPILRRAMFGMTPLKALAMLPYMPFQAGDTCITYLSEFDFTNQERFPASWFRPYASWKTLPQVVRCIGSAAWGRDGGQLVDYAMAATWESWRMRDFARQLVFHFWGRPADHGKGETGALSSIRDALAAQQAELTFSPAEQKAFKRFARHLQQGDVRLVVFEGDVNPLLYSPSHESAKAITRHWLVTFGPAPEYEYVSLAEQNLALGPEAWKDMTHLNEQGRAVLTQRMAQWLKAHP
ncbi:MAG: hypothetical protein LBN38_02925 [Verrucomicrobiota bacterium]|jgi:hypothetical protein|nr:hypothetical protein [Verrucomicrobiota bacterium]